MSYRRYDTELNFCIYDENNNIDETKALFEPILTANPGSWPSNIKFWTMVVGQLIEQSLPTTNIRGSIPSKIYLNIV